MKKLNVALSVACGLFGGVLSHYVWTQPVHAQGLAAAPLEIRAQSFVLVNGKGDVEGVFSFEQHKHGPPTIKLLDGNGHEIWKAGGGNGLELVGGASGSEQP
jgi:hypothetical protein